MHDSQTEPTPWSLTSRCKFGPTNFHADFWTPQIVFDFKTVFDNRHWELSSTTDFVCRTLRNPQTRKNYHDTVNQYLISVSAFNFWNFEIPSLQLLYQYIALTNFNFPIHRPHNWVSPREPRTTFHTKSKVKPLNLICMSRISMRRCSFVVQNPCEIHARYSLHQCNLNFAIWI